MTWSNRVFPFGDFEPGFEIVQTHRALIESASVEVPAGRIMACIRVETQALTEIAAATGKARSSLIWIGTRRELGW